MGAYILILCLLLLVGLLSRESVLQGKGARVGVIVACAFVLFIPAAIRAGSVGADTQQYCDVFSWICTVPLADIATARNPAWWSAGQDYTYLLYNKVLSIFGDNPQIITVANSALLVAALARFVRNESCDSWMSFLLFFTLGFYQLSLNLTPSSIASLIMLGSLRYVREGRLVPWIASVAVAYIFHASAVFFIPLYFLLRVDLSRKAMIWVCILGIFVGLFAYSPIFNLLLYLVPSKYAGYLTASTVKYEAMLVLVAYCCVLMMAVLSEKKHAESSDAKWLLTLMLISYAFSVHNSYISRFAFLFSPYMVVLVPVCLYSGRGVERSINAAKLPRDKRVSEGYTFAVVFISIAFYFARVSINNIGTTMPYEVFFSL